MQLNENVGEQKKIFQKTAITSQLQVDVLGLRRLIKPDRSESNYLEPVISRTEEAQKQIKTKSKELKTSQLQQDSNLLYPLTVKVGLGVLKQRLLLISKSLSAMRDVVKVATLHFQ